MAGAQGGEVIPFERGTIGEDPSALDSILARDADLVFFEFLNELNDINDEIEDDGITNAPWGSGEVEDGSDTDWWYSDEVSNCDEIERLEAERGAADWAAMKKAEEAIAEAAQARSGRTFYQKKPIPSELRWAVFRRDGYRCVHCGYDADLTADHIEAEVKGGRLGIDNLQTLCRPCNSRKGAR